MDAKKQLKISVKELAALGRAIRTEKIRTTSGLDRYYAWLEKRGVGSDARSALLAYAFVRGRPYRSTERRAMEDAVPHLQGWLAAHVAKVLKTVGARDGDDKAVKAEVLAWMQADEAARQAA